MGSSNLHRIVAYISNLLNFHSPLDLLKLKARRAADTGLSTVPHTFLGRIQEITKTPFCTLHAVPNAQWVLYSVKTQIQLRENYSFYYFQCLWWIILPRYINCFPVGCLCIFRVRKAFCQYFQKMCPYKLVFLDSLCRICIKRMKNILILKMIPAYSICNMKIEHFFTKKI